MAMDDIKVQVRRLAEGVSFSTLLLRRATPAQVNRALSFGCHSAARFECGLAMSEHGGDLLLMQWQPGRCDAKTEAALTDRLKYEASIWLKLLRDTASTNDAAIAARQDLRTRRVLVARP